MDTVDTEHPEEQPDHDHALTGEAAHRRWEWGLTDVLMRSVERAPGPALTPEQEEQQRLLDRLLTFARDYGRGLRDDDYLRRECLAIMIAMKTSAFCDGLTQGLAMRRGGDA